MALAMKNWIWADWIVGRDPPAAAGCAAQPMTIRYFPDTDTPYIALAKRESASSEAISDSSAIETLLPITPALQPA